MFIVDAAVTRCRLYANGESQIAALAAAVAGSTYVGVQGPAGCGKSALIANWLAQARRLPTQPLAHVIQHQSAHAADRIVFHSCSATRAAATLPGVLRHVLLQLGAFSTTLSTWLCG